MAATATVAAAAILIAVDNELEADTDTAAELSNSAAVTAGWLNISSIS